MRKLIAVALLGASAAIFSATAPAQAMTAAGAGIAKSATAETAVQEVKRRWKRHRHYKRHRWHRHRHYHGRRWHRHRPYYYYGGGYPYYPYYYHRRPRVGIYFGF